MTARKFALDFYGSLNQQVQGRDYARAFQQAVARMASGGGAARIRMKHLAAGAVDYVCLLSEHGDEFPDTGHIRQGQESDEDSRNWRPPNKDTDFAAHAGQAEKSVLHRLNFNLLLNGKEIGGSHGLDRKGFLTQEALQAIGIGNYARLWRTSGKVVEEARKMLRREKSSAAAREQVRLARSDLELSIFYRQLDIMAFRFKPQHTPRWYAHKAALLRRGKEDILNEHRRDCEDRERLRLGQTVADTRKQELASACNSHLYQIDMRDETMQGLQGLLLCQVPRCVCSFYRMCSLTIECVLLGEEVHFGAT